MTFVSTHVSITSQRTDDGEFRYRCQRAPDGRTPQLVGCSHNAPRSAMAHSDELTGRAASRSEPEQGMASLQADTPSVSQARSGAPLVEDAGGAPPLDPVPGSAHPESGVRSRPDPAVPPVVGSGSTLGL